MRVALFGGTFDPPHRGHFSIAAAAADAFSIDTVLFAPTGRQPLKLSDTPTPYADRLAMVTLACLPDPRFGASNLDAPRSDGLPNYTVDALSRLHQLMPGAKLFNLVGADSFLDLPRWHQPDRLLELAEWIVVSRPGFPLDDLSSLNLTSNQRSRVHVLQTIHDDVSATMLRERLKSGDDCTDLLPQAVLDYIRTHQLYR
jgi:nicotinate-nucleotide adenylyltransferase